MFFIQIFEFLGFFLTKINLSGTLNENERLGWVSYES